MRTSLRGLAIVALAGAATTLVGCGGGSPPATTSAPAPTAAPAPAPTAAPAPAPAPADTMGASGASGAVATTDMPSQAAIDEAETIFKTRCSVCHGLEGKGDGPGAVALNPKPRNYGDAAWQATVTDHEIETAIVKGGAAVGKSPLMAPNPDLEGKPEVVAALRMKVRSFAPKAP